MANPIAVILNIAAGADDKKAVADNLTAIFRSGGLDAHVTLTSNGGEIIEAARHAVRQKPCAMVAGGGDGTVNTVASILVGSDIAFGVLPLGTLNHFAKDLSIPLELEAATHNIIAGHAIQIDVGEVNGRIFLNNSSLRSLSNHGDSPRKAAGTVGTPQVARLCLGNAHHAPALSVHERAIEHK